MTSGTDGSGAAERSFEELYDELRRQAHRIVSREAPGCSVEATGLVHEAYEHVVHTNPEAGTYQDPRHLLNALTLKMHRILLDRARRRGSAKRGGDRQRERADVDTLRVDEMDDMTLLSLRQAVEDLEQSSAESAELVNWHIYGGLSIAQVAAKMGVSRSKADKLWLHARHWLRRRMSDLGD